MQFYIYVHTESSIDYTDNYKYLGIDFTEHLGVDDGHSLFRTL